MADIFPAGSISRRSILKGSLAASSIALAGDLFVPAISNAMQTPTGRNFSNPDRIRYDGQCLVIDGKDTFIFSGSFHYFRCAKPLWRRRFEKIKQAGFNCIQTYIPWNVHENTMPKSLNDYSHVDLTDLEDFLAMASDFGLYVLARPGPYICAEWDTGGFPQWLITKRPGDYKGLWLRSDEPTFMAWSRHWYNAVCPTIAKYQITHKKAGQPGVIMFQVENEYDFPSFPLHEKREYVRSLVRGALANGINVPIYINWGSCVLGAKDHLLRQVFDTCDFYPAHDVASVAVPIFNMAHAQPHAPRMTTELQGGWFTGVGQAPSLVPSADRYTPGIGPAQINNLTLFVFALGNTITNYYMLFGGTNMDGRAGEGIATSYDYSAPIRECGGVGEKFQRVRAIAGMLKIHGPRLCRAKDIPVRASTGFKDVFVLLRQAEDGSRYYFLRNAAANQSRHGTAHVRLTGGNAGMVSFPYALEPFGSKVLFVPAGTSAAQGTWLPEQSAPIRRPDNLPGPVTISEVRWAEDPGAQGWQLIREGQTLAELGIYTSRAVFYRRKIHLSAADIHSGDLVIRMAIAGGGGFVARVNGYLVSKNANGAVPIHGAKHLKIGENVIEVLYQDNGHPNFGNGIEQTYGVTQLDIARPPLLAQKFPRWKMQMIHKCEHPEKLAQIQPHFNDSRWKSVNASSIDAKQLAPNQTAVFRTHFQVSAAQLNSVQTLISYGRVNDQGAIFLNGQRLGNTSNLNRQQYEFSARHLLKAGRNTLVVVVHNQAGVRGLGDVSLASPWRPLNTSALEFSSLSGGTFQDWSSPAFCACGWRSETIPRNTSATEPSALLTWHRLSFTLPESAKGVWIPWCLELSAHGNGFIFLNGYNIGRHWQQGGQQYFFLPECWLKFGSGRTNAITLCLHQQDVPAGVVSASIVPYTAYAEHDSVL